MDEYAIKLLEEIAYRITPRNVEKDEFLAQFKAQPKPEPVDAMLPKRKPIRK